jgi:hypothetical protein
MNFTVADVAVMKRIGHGPVVSWKNASFPF